MNQQPRIGAIVRCDNTGLGIQTREFYNHIPCKALVIDMSHITSGNPPMQQHHQWYPGQTVVYLQNDKRIPYETIRDFIKDIDVLIAFETPYDYSIFDVCRQQGVKSVLQLNYEFLEYPPPMEHQHARPDLFLAPSLWHYSDIPAPKAHLHVPVNTLHFLPQVKPKTFVHIAGTLPSHDRNGTDIFFTALQHVKNEITAIVHSQRTLGNYTVPPHIHLVLNQQNKPDYASNYQGGVLVMPRKFGGNCLPANEALAAEMPVIMPDISPNNKWLPKEWLTAARPLWKFMVKKEIMLYEPDPISVARKIDEFCDNDFYMVAIEKAKVIKANISWQNMRQQYLDLFREMSSFIINS